MKEVSLDPIKKHVNSILKDMCIAEHQTGPFGNVKPNFKAKKKKKNLPQSINEEISGLTKTILKCSILRKINDTEVNGGFGTTPKDEDEDDKDKFMPEKISSEKKDVVGKATYEYVAANTSYTDESNPAEDAFYTPEDIKLESKETDKNAKEKEKKKKELEENSFGNIEENISDQGAARTKQGYNTGTIESAQIGNQGGSL